MQKPRSARRRSPRCRGRFGLARRRRGGAGGPRSTRRRRALRRRPGSAGLRRRASRPPPAPRCRRRGSRTRPRPSSLIRRAGAWTENPSDRDRSGSATSARQAHPPRPASSTCRCPAPYRSLPPRPRHRRWAGSAHARWPGGKTPDRCWPPCPSRSGGDRRASSPARDFAATSRSARRRGHSISSGSDLRTACSLPRRSLARCGGAARSGRCRARRTAHPRRIRARRRRSPRRGRACRSGCRYRAAAAGSGCARSGRNT